MIPPGSVEDTVLCAPSGAEPVSLDPTALVVAGASIVLVSDALDPWSEDLTVTTISELDSLSVDDGGAEKESTEVLNASVLESTDEGDDVGADVLDGVVGIGVEVAETVTGRAVGAGEADVEKLTVGVSTVSSCVNARGGSYNPTKFKAHVLHAGSILRSSGGTARTGL